MSSAAWQTASRSSIRRFTARGAYALLYQREDVTVTDGSRGGIQWLPLRAVKVLREKIAAVWDDPSVRGFLLAELTGFLAYGFGNPLLSFYNKDAEVISMGMIRLMLVGTTYGLDAIMDVLADIIRGMGSSILPMIVTLIGACGFRVVWIYTVFAANHDLRVLYISYPISWILTSLTHAVCYFIVKRRRLRGLMEGVPTV